MELLNRLSIKVFNCLAAARGYTFKKVSNEKEYSDACLIYDEDAFSFPEHLLADVQRFKAGTINFIAYCKGIPVGMVRLANPRVINRAYEHYGVDKEGVHHEIQSLVVRKQYRDGAQFVMLGLVKELYVYSKANSISTWSACGKRNVYLTMKRYCKNIKVIDVDFNSIQHPVTQYLCANEIIETYFIMGVAAFAPWQILKKTIRKIVRKWSITEFFRNRMTTAVSRLSMSIPNN